MWKSRAHESLYLLVLPDSFVFVVETTAPVARKTSGSAFSSPRERLNTLNASPIIKQLVSASPFTYDDRGGGSGGAIFAFEVHHDRVAGVNYQNPLLRQGRLTVEAFGVTKRGFGSMRELRAWYGVEEGEGGVGGCAVCALRGSEGRPGSAARKSLRFGGGEERGEERGGAAVDVDAGELMSTRGGDEDTEMSSFAFCVEGVEDGGGGLEDDATSCVVVERSEGSAVTVSGSEGEKKGRSPWSALKLRRNTNGNSGFKKSPPSTDNLPRLNIPAKTLIDRDSIDREDRDCRDADRGGRLGELKTYAYRTIAADFANPHVPCALAPVFKQHSQGSERLLKMVESGLPSWAMFLPSYGMYYRCVVFLSSSSSSLPTLCCSLQAVVRVRVRVRVGCIIRPWVRSVTWVFFYAFSVVSLTLGFYDLYRTLPGLQDALAKLVESYHISVWWPITSAYRWIESHAQLRLSIFLTYLFGKSELFYSFNMIAVQWFWYIFEPVRAVVMPVAYVLYAPMRLLLSLWSYSLGVVYSPVTFAWSLASRVEVMQAARGSAGVGWITVSEAMRQSLVTAMRAYVYCSFSSLSLCTARRVPARPPAHALTPCDRRSTFDRSNNVWKFVMNVCGGVSRHRMTLGRRVARNWGRLLAMIEEVLYWVLRAFGVGTRVGGGGEFSDEYDGEVVVAEEQQNSLSFSNAFGSANEDDEVDSTATTTKVTEQSNKKDD